MRAVDVRIRHDDDLVVAQIVDVEFGPHADAHGLTKIVDLLVRADLGRGGAEHVQDLAAQGQEGLRFTVARHLGRAAGRVALHQEQFG